jgi:hypothetical protein
MFGHAFTRMLPMNDPTHRLTTSMNDTLDFTPIQTLSQTLHRGKLRTPRHQTQVTRIGKGRKVTEKDRTTLDVHMLPAQLTVRVVRLLIAVPGIGVGDIGRVADGGSCDPVIK